MIKKEALSVDQFIQRYNNELPLSHWLDYADPYSFNHIAKNAIRIRRIEQTLNLSVLTVKERQEITNQLKNEAQEKWRKTNEQHLALSKIKLHNRWVGWRFCMSPLIFLYRIFVSVAAHGLPRQIWNIFFSRPQSNSKDCRANSIETESSNNKESHNGSILPTTPKRKRTTLLLKPSFTTQVG